MMLPSEKGLRHSRVNQALLAIVSTMFSTCMVNCALQVVSFATVALDNVEDPSLHTKMQAFNVVLLVTESLNVWA